VLEDPTGSCNETLRFVLTIQACSWSDNFLDSKQIIRYLVHCFSYCRHSSVCQMAWKRWLSNRMSVYVVQLLFVSRIAVAISSCCCKVFIQYFRLMYWCGTCSESKEQREESEEEGAEEVRGILSTVLLDKSFVQELGG
jgi:hypothetical protein